MKTVNILHHSIVIDLVSRDRRPVVVDCGANHGGFSRWASQSINAEVYGFEPDPRLFEKLPALEGATFYQKAIAGKTGKMRLNLGAEACSSLRFSEHVSPNSIDVETTTLDEFVDEKNLDRIEILKLDIEGAELDVLSGSTESALRRCTQITVEFHDHLEKSDIPLIRNVIQRMKQLGFLAINFSHSSYGDVLFLNQEHVHLTASNRASILLFGKYFPGIRRRLSRIAG